MRYEIILPIIVVIFVAGCMGQDTQSADNASTTSILASPISTTAGSGNIKTTTTESDEEEMPTTTMVRVPANITNCLVLDNVTIRDACFFDAAGKDKDASACEKIEYNNLKLKCMARLQDNPDYCDKIDRLSEKDWCYRMMAFKWNQMRYCKMVFAAPIRDKCILDFVRDKKPDPYECFQIVNSRIKDECIYYHIDVYNRTGAGIKPKLCTLILNSSLQLRCNQTFLNQKA
jgi:hypothetical protein